MDVIYDNGMYQILINKYDNEYLIVNKETDVVEARESALPTAKFKANGLVAASKKFDMQEGVE